MGVFVKQKVYAIIPARSGSKGVPDKNIALLGGHPLLAWSIMAARLSKCVDRVVVSTDSEKYAGVARKYGADVPFLRPSVISGDFAQDIGFFMHALLWFAEKESEIPDFLVHLRPTTPVRTPAVIDEAVSKLLADNEATSIISAHEAAHPPCKCFQQNSDGTLSGLFGEEYVSWPRQQCPKAYQGNGIVDVLRSQHILDTGTLYGKRRLALLTPPSIDIDSAADLLAAEHLPPEMNSMRECLVSCGS